MKHSTASNSIKRKYIYEQEYSNTTPRILVPYKTSFCLERQKTKHVGTTKQKKKNRKTLKNHSTPSEWNAVKWKGHSGNSFFRFHFLIHKSAEHAHPFLHSLFPVTNLSWRFTNLPYGRVNPFRKTRGYSLLHYTDLT